MPKEQQQVRLDPLPGAGPHGQPLSLHQCLQITVRSICRRYRCPAAAFGLDCKGRGACHRAGGVKLGDYGRIVRVDLDKHDRRIFTPTPWGSPSWRREYNRRSAMERINARLDRSFNFETHYIRGLARMKTRVGLALAVMMAMALALARPGRADRMRSLVGAVP